MSALRIAIARLRALFRRDATTDEIREELNFHLAMRADEYARHGLEAPAARQAALRRFGNPAVIQDRGYDVRGGGLMETILQDVKYALRQLGRQPSFSILAGLTLALGIGVSTALFSVIDAALLRPLPYPHPEELVTISVEEQREGKPSRYGPSMADIRTWRTLTTIVAQAGMGRVSGFVPLIVDTGTAQRLTVAEASEGFLETYGIQPILGRGIQADDTRDGAPRVALLGHAYWQREFGSDPDVVGRSLRVQNQPVTIVGVLPAGFYRETAVWQARQFSAARLDRRGSGTPVIARLRPGVTLAQARTAFDAVTVPSTINRPAPAPVRVVIESMYDDETSQFGATIRTLSLAVGLILIIACVNVAGLLLARGATRDVELAIRAAIGAGRGRLVRQLLTESVLLALAGALAGVLIAYASLDALVALVPLTLPANSPVRINATVLTFALGLTVMTALLFGLVPALKLSRAPSVISTVLTLGGRSGAPLSRRAGQWLIGVEVALALVLMAGAGLILRSFAKLVSVDLGFSTANVLTLEVEPLDQAAPVRRDYYASITDALRRLPEVVSAGVIDQLALGGGGSFAFPEADTGVTVAGPQRIVLPGYLEAIGVRAIAGRLLEDADRAAGEAVVVNATLSQQYFGGDAVGHTLLMGDKNPRLLRIVGIVPDLRHGGPQGRVQPEAYILPDPLDAAASSMRLAIVMRLREGASLSIDRLKETAESVGPRVLVGRVRPAAALVSEQVARPRHRMLLLTMLGVFGLLLTLVGIFSMTAYAVARRTREVGVRVAFGARPAQVVRVMIRDVVWPVVLGIVAGLAGTYYATRLITSFLFQTAPHDAATLAAVVVLLGAAACVAAWLPARRAASIDPVAALRAE
jgi:putative ABC transport system permease protein